MNGVVLYSGRWRPNVDDSIWNHRSYLVDPHHLDVVVVGIRSQICRMQNFESSVRAAWGLNSRRLLVSQHRDILPTEDTKFAKAYRLSPWKLSQLQNWEVQFSHVRLAFERALHWKKHDIFIRARIDRLFTAPIPLQFSHGQVLAIVSRNGWAVQRNTTIVRDWFYVTDANGMRAITNTSVKLIDASARCFATCPEEQVKAHISQSEHIIVPINATLRAVSKEKWCPTNQRGR